MHGLIFVTWEQYLQERFNAETVSTYRTMIRNATNEVHLASRIYDDSTFLKGVEIATKITRMPAQILLREYGRSFMRNSLVNHRCAYVLERANNARDLLLLMRTAHGQMRMTSQAMSPPIFAYEAISNNPNHLVLIYNSPRKLCALLMGAVDGAADRYGEMVHIKEHSCMQNGAQECRIEIKFSGTKVHQLENKEMQAKKRIQKQLADSVLQILSYNEQLSLQELQQKLKEQTGPQSQIRPSLLLGAVQHLQHAGLVASTADQPGDEFSQRRYWRVKSQVL